MYIYIYNASALKRITANHLGYKVYQPLKFEVQYYWGAMLNKVSLRHVTSRHVTSRHVTSRHVTLNLFWYTKTGPPSVLRTYHGGTSPTKSLGRSLSLISGKCPKNPYSHFYKITVRSSNQQENNGWRSVVAPWDYHLSNEDTFRSKTLRAKPLRLGSAFAHSEKITKPLI